MAKVIEINGLNELIKTVEGLGSVGKKAASTSINRTATFVKSQVSISARQETTVKSAFAKKGISVPYKATLNRLGSRVVISGKRIPLIGYQARQVKKGVSGRIFKNKPLILRPTAFIATMPSGHKGVFWRDKRKGGGGVPVGPQLFRFIAAMKRKTPSASIGTLVSRLGITELHGPSLPDLIKSDTVWIKIRNQADIRLAKELETNMAFYMDQLK